MKILWVNTNFMHPTTKGGQIRTLEMLRCLHRWHEIHYVALENPNEPEGPQRAHEYSTRAYPFRHSFPDKRSLAFAGQVFTSVFHPVPIGITRFSVPALGRFLLELSDKIRFDRAVCDFLTPVSYFPDIEKSVLFQHNVEAQIWKRYAQHASNPLSRSYFRLQADRMLRYEADICRRAGHVVAVSQQDAAIFRDMGATRVSAIPTGVDIDYFRLPQPPPEREIDLVFVGSMDWLPNIDGMQWFVRDVLPIIRKTRPNTSVAIVGRTPPASVRSFAEADPLITVTGTVPDVRPWMWKSRLSIVPLRIGGGTRLKIYESMAACLSVVSTAVGAEGLTISPPHDIRIGDSPERFAAECIDLLDNESVRQQIAGAARKTVEQNFSWERVARVFDDILKVSPQFR